MTEMFLWAKMSALRDFCPVRNDRKQFVCLTSAQRLVPVLELQRNNCDCLTVTTGSGKQFRYFQRPIGYLSLQGAFYTANLLRHISIF